MGDINIRGELVDATKNQSINLFKDFNVNTVMRQIVTLLDTPVKVVLIIMLIITIVMIGELIAEMLQRRAINIKAAKVIDAIKEDSANTVSIIRNTNLLDKQKHLLLEVFNHNELSPEMKESLAASLLDNYDRQQNIKIKRTDLITKLGPTFGLLGTLIPLGPGIIALAQGDTATLSYSLLAAFDTTVIGLICGAVCTVLSLIRRNWYNKDKIMLTLIMEAIIETNKN